MLSVTRLYKARLGERAELDTLLQENVSLHHYFSETDKATPAQLAAAETYLLDQLQHIATLLQQMEEAKLAYISRKEELIEWRISVDEKIKIARNSLTVWAQSHRNLGSGIPVPPMIDVAGFTSGLVGSAANKIVP